jgi:hypothetical protein
MHNKTYRLHKWSVTDGFVDDPYLAPERRIQKFLIGFRDDETRQIRTSMIVKIDGRTITTYSGSTYILEDIDPDYLLWMNEHGYIYDYDHPIADKRKQRG